MTRRNVAVFFDGTGQNRSEKPFAEWSNVALLHDATANEDVGVAQSRKYVDGVGTRPGETITGGGFGIDLDKRVEEAYDFIYEEANNAKEDGEEPHLYLFGFSRGAYAARWLASLVQFAGVRKDGVATRKLMSAHRDGDADFAADLRRRGLTMDDVPIDFLGVWDTVEASVDPSFGIADVPAVVGRACHALAIDEWRFTFSPTRFNPSPKVSEVWFPGCHTDVGGGYAERAIANESLRWMAGEAARAGLAVDDAALEASIAGRSSALLYHDELAASALWQTLNEAAGFDGRYFRRIQPTDVVHPAVRLFASAAPSDRAVIPETCVVWNAPDAAAAIA